MIFTEGVFFSTLYDVHSFPSHSLETSSLGYWNWRTLPEVILYSGSLNLKTEITILANSDQISLFVLWIMTKIGPRFSFNFTSNKKKTNTLTVTYFQLSACQKLVRCSSKSLQNLSWICRICRVYANKTEQLDGQMTLKNKVGNNTVEHKET